MKQIGFYNNRILEILKINQDMSDVKRTYEALKKISSDNLKELSANFNLQQNHEDAGPIHPIQNNINEDPIELKFWLFDHEFVIKPEVKPFVRLSYFRTYRIEKNNGKVEHKPIESLDFVFDIHKHGRFLQKKMVKSYMGVESDISFISVLPHQYMMMMELFLSDEEKEFYNRIKDQLS